MDNDFRSGDLARISSNNSFTALWREELPENRVVRVIRVLKKSSFVEIQSLDKNNFHNGSNFVLVGVENLKKL